MGIKDLKKSLDKQFGEGVVTFLNEKATAREAYSTGVLSIDYSTVIGGLPKGFYCEIYGKESTGKTTYACTAAAEVQKQGKFVLWLDYENSFDQIYFQNLGLQVGEDKFMLAYPDTLEDGFKIILQAVADPEIDIGLIVIDSIAIAPPGVDAEKLLEDDKLGKRRVGGTAATIAQILKQIQPFFTKRKDCTLLVINQLRYKISSWITTQETTGGNSLKYAFHVRQEIKKKQIIKTGGKPVGLRLAIKTTKSKVGVPMREVETDLIFGTGFDKAADAFSVALATGVLVKEGPMYKIPGTDLTFRGLPPFREHWEADEAFRKDLRVRVLACGAPKVSVGIADEEVGKVAENIDPNAEVDGATILEQGKLDGPATDFGKPVDLASELVQTAPKAKKKRGRPKKENVDG
jgi:recombination protein RecA